MHDSKDPSGTLQHIDAHRPSSPEAPEAEMPLKFGPFTIPTTQIFHRTPLTFCLVNLRPLLPGHILVCPKRSVPTIAELSRDETADLFLTVQKMQRVLRRGYHADGFNVAVQDGAAAGQSVPHVHAHVIPRRWGDEGQEDKLYGMMESESGDLSRVFNEELSRAGGRMADGRERRRQSFPVPSGERKNRSFEEMGKEAEWLRELVKEVEMEEAEEEEREKLMRGVACN